MLKVELESDDSTRLMEGLRRKRRESKPSQREGEKHVGRTGRQGSRDTWNSAPVGYDWWLSAVGPEVVWVSDPVDLGQDCGFSTR